MKNTFDIQETLAGCLRDNRVHQRALVDNYSGLLYVICNRYLGDAHLAQDAVQESWSLIFKNLDKYDSTKGKFESWASKISIRQCLNNLAKKKLKIVDFTATSVGETSSDLQKQMMSRLNANQLTALVTELPESYRTVFNMVVIDGYTHKEIADLLNLTVVNSRARLNRARNILKEKINSLNNTDSWVNTI